MTSIEESRLLGQMLLTLRLAEHYTGLLAPDMLPVIKPTAYRYLKAAALFRSMLKHHTASEIDEITDIYSMILDRCVKLTETEAKDLVKNLDEYLAEKEKFLAEKR